MQSRMKTITQKNQLMDKKSDESSLENTLGASSLATFVSQTEPITINDKCMEDLYGKDLVCEAKDVSIANVTDIEFIDNDTCDSPEDTVKFRAKWEVQPTSTKKYNIGLYFPTEGQSNALNGQCSITSLPNSPTPPWYNFDDNICGDISSDGPVFPVIELEVKCLDPDGDNVLNLPYCTSWEQNSSACSGPLNTIPGAPSKCNCNDGFEVPITVPYKANIEVIKDLNPSTDLGEFKLNLNGNGITEETSCVGDAGTTGKITIGAGTSKNPGATYTIGEKACDGTNISSYSTSISCVSRSTGNLVATGTGTSLQLTVNKDDDVVCTITNDQKTANITVIKEIINDNGGKKGLTDFGITFSGGDLTFDSGVTVGDKTTYTSKPINVGDLTNPFTLYELDLSDYDESDWSCGETVREENEVQTSFSFKPGENKTCKITNNDKPATLIVKKVRVGHDTPYENFAFSVNQESEIVFEQDGQNDLVLNAGTYNVTETSTSSDYIVTYDNCTNLNITNGKTETCTITNTKKGTIIVEKEVLPKDSKQTFSFSGDLTGTIGHGGQINKQVDPGTYNVYEDFPFTSGYQLKNITCDDSDSTYDVSAGSATFKVDAGETVKCTFTNEIFGLITAQKFHDIDGNGTKSKEEEYLSGWTMNLYEGFGCNEEDLIKSSVTDTTGKYTFTSLKPGEYSVSEDLQSGWYNTTDVCQNVTLSAGELEILDFGNAMFGSISGTKYYVMSDGTMMDPPFTILNWEIFIDLNENGEYDKDETKVLTDKDGVYKFENLKIGKYRICEIMQSSYGNYDPICQNVNITVSDEQITKVDFKNYGYGYLKVIKDIEPDTTQDTFTIYVNDDPVLVDISTDSETTELKYPVGNYTVSEKGSNLGSYYKTYSLDCDKSGNVSVELNKTSTCKLTNTLTGSITIIKDRMPDYPEQFEFTGDLGTFYLTDMSDKEREKSFTGLTPGQYEVVEGLMDETYLDSIVCESSTPTPNDRLFALSSEENEVTVLSKHYTSVEERKALIDLTSGENVTCTFTNKAYGSIHGFKWNDLNGNGEYDCINEQENSDKFARPICEMEPKLPGWTIFIDSNENSQLDEGEKFMETSYNSEPSHYGWYWFEKLVHGEYRICEVLQNGWEQTYPVNPSCHTVTLPYDISDPELRFSENYVIAPEYNFGNTYEAPELTISKFNNVNDGAIISEQGGSVLYTIIIKANKNKVYNVEVFDLPPNGFKYRPGSWTSVSNTRGNLAGVVTNEPAYASPGKWYLGDMEMDEEVTLTYIADIDNNQEPGTYRDLAWAKGYTGQSQPTILDDSTSETQSQDETNNSNSDNGDSILALAEDQGFVDTYFVGTAATIEPSPETPEDDVEIDEEVIEEEGEVLGASTLPATGASPFWITISLLGLALGLGSLLTGKLLQNSKYKKLKMNKNLVILITATLIFLFSVAKVNAATDSLAVRIQTPYTYSNSYITVGFVAMDLDNNPISVECYKKGPEDGSFVKFDTTKNLQPGGNSGVCTTGSNDITSNGLYSFKVKATSDSGTLESQEVSTTFDNGRPDRPKYIEVDRDGKCEYDIAIRTANDGRTSSIEIYRGNDTEFTANADSLIRTISIGPDEKVEFESTVSGSECDKEQFFATRSFDKFGNFSEKLRKQEVTIYETVEGSDSSSNEDGSVSGSTGSSNTGAILVDSGSASSTGTGDTGSDGTTTGDTETRGDGTEGTVTDGTGDDTTDEESIEDEGEGSVLGEETESESRNIFQRIWDLIVGWIKSIFNSIFGGNDESESSQEESSQDTPAVEEETTEESVQE